jgi:Tfp pilus assembly protein PilZ
MHIFFRHGDETYPSRVLNMGRGGLFLFSRALLERGRKVVVYLPNLDCDLGDLFETEGRVAWTTRRASDSKVLHGMGIHFSSVKDLASEQLDSFLIEQLDTRLYKTARTCDPRLELDRFSTL